MNPGLPQNVTRVLGRKGRACALVVVDSPSGLSAALINLIVAKDHTTVRFAMEREAPLFEKVANGQRVAILIADEGNIACFIRGHPHVLRLACKTDPSWAIIEVTVDEVDDITIPDAVVSSGIRVCQRRERVDLVSRSVLAELTS
ncbi:MAG TPA: hypothetical protein GX506_01955 [Firmicutes bacterium]|nr:hypothetical protein [Bacillota bacterium]